MKNTEDQNYFGTSNFWLGVVIVFLICVVSYVSLCNTNEYLMTGSSSEKFSVYLMITYSCFAILVIASVLFALAARKEAERLGSSENLLARQNEIQEEIMVDGNPEVLDVWLAHDDELLFAVGLEDEKRSRIFFRKYVGFCSEEAKLQAWFLACKIGNLEIIKEIVESSMIPDLNASNKDYDNDTAAHIAVIYNQDEVLEYFKELNSKGRMDFSLKNNEGKTPFELFPEKQRKIAELLSDFEPEVDRVIAGNPEFFLPDDRKIPVENKSTEEEIPVEDFCIESFDDKSQDDDKP